MNTMMPPPAACAPESISWMGETMIHTALEEARRAGVTPRTILSCRQAQRALPQNAPQPGQQRQRILIVEPDAKLAASMAAALGAGSRYEVAVAADSAQALDCVRRGAPDLIITEMALPEGSTGASLANCARVATRCHMPVIILENSAAAEDSVAANQNALHLRKPVKLRALLHCAVHLLQAAQRAE